MKISHKTILVTGSSKRIGQEIAYYLAKKNAKVVIHYNNSKLDAYKTYNNIKKNINPKCMIIKSNLESVAEVEI